MAEALINAREEGVTGSEASIFLFDRGGPLGKLAA